MADTNVLLRLQDPDDDQFTAAAASVRAIIDAGHQLVVGQQMHVEFWRVCTSERKVALPGQPPPRGARGFGFDLAETERRLRRVERLTEFLHDHQEQPPTWRRIVSVSPGVVGLNVYDARIAAFTLAHGLTHLLTFNLGDFRRYQPQGLVLVDPADPMTWPAGDR